MILRGGRGAPNYDAGGSTSALELLRAAGLPERLIVDASHDNSGKDHERQPKVAADIADQVAAGNGAIVGVMLESFLVAGRQDLGPERAGLRPVDHRRVHGLGARPLLALDRLAGAVRGAPLRR